MPMSSPTHDGQRNLQAISKKLRYLVEGDAKRLNKSCSRAQQEEKNGISEAK
jgi:hypothetical protein